MDLGAGGGGWTGPIRALFLSLQPEQDERPADPSHVPCLRWMTREVRVPRGPDDGPTEYQDVAVSVVQAMSGWVCIDFGKPARMRYGNWFQPLCSVCWMNASSEQKALDKEYRERTGGEGRSETQQSTGAAGEIEPSRAQRQNRNGGRAMADQLDNRPVFTIVMGCNGAEKSAWKRANQDRLPERYFDKDSVADGVGGWDTASARERTDEIINAELDRALAGQHNFGIESTYSGQPGRTLVTRAINAGYRIEGVCIGRRRRRSTASVSSAGSRTIRATTWTRNACRNRYRHSLHNLRQTAQHFEELTIVDNSAERDRGIPDPTTELVLERGRTTHQTTSPATWVATWKERFEMSTESHERNAAMAARGVAQAPRAKIGSQPKAPAEAPQSAAGAAAAQGRQRNHDDTPPP